MCELREDVSHGRGVVEPDKCPSWCVVHRDHDDEMHWSEYEQTEVISSIGDDDSGPTYLSMRLGKGLTWDRSAIYLDEIDFETGEESNLLTISPVEALRLSRAFKTLIEQQDRKDLLEIIQMHSGMTVEADVCGFMARMLEQRGGVVVASHCQCCAS